MLASPFQGCLDARAGSGGWRGSRGLAVTWHFAINLLPMPFAMIGLIEEMRDKSFLAQTKLQPDLAKSWQKLVHLLG